MNQASEGLREERLASLTFDRPQDMTARERRLVANWIRRQVYLLEHHPDKIHKAGYTAAYARWVEPEKHKKKSIGELEP